MKKILSILIVFTLIAPIFYPKSISNAQETKSNSEVFFDDFDGNSLNQDKWLIAYKNWGGKDSTGKDYNGGVVPQNVSVSDGTLKLEAHGNNYEGDVLGINKNKSLRSDGKRVGAAIATKEYYASGSYEVVAKVAPELGACSAIWTFEYEEYYPGDEKYKKMPVGGNDYYAVNHEIDIEMPGRPSSAKVNQSFEYALCNTWIGENNSEYTVNYTKLPKVQNDGKFHKYRFDWHTGDDNETARVEFYFDDVLVYTATTHIPTNASRLWIGVWFPKEWAGTPNFDTSLFEVDYVKITPFNEAGDTPQAESFPNDGWAFPSDIEVPKDPSEEPKDDPTNLVLNGNFDLGSSNWDTSGGTSISDVATLASGSNTDTLSQTISVSPDTEYTLSFDVTSSGTLLDYGVNDYNGKYTKLKESTDSSGKKVLHFKTGKNINEITVFFNVLRYQNSKSPVTIDNICLVKGNKVVDDTNTEESKPTNPDDKPDTGDSETTNPGVKPEVKPETNNNLLKNGDFSLDSEFWTKTGGAEILNKKALLASGSNTDVIKQTIKVKPNTTYELSADIKSFGTVIDMGVKDYAGRYTDLKSSYNNNSRGSLKFTTASHISEITIYFQVLRYQGTSDTVEVDNVSLIEAI
ncbi:family 16 glycosylhydrolase [Intestinibacter sp.]